MVNAGSFLDNVGSMFSQFWPMWGQSVVGVTIVGGKCVVNVWSTSGQFESNASPMRVQCEFNVSPM